MDKTTFVSDITLAPLNVLFILSILASANQMSRAADIESEIHKYVLEKISAHTEGGKKASPKLSDLFDELRRTLEVAPETAIPSLKHRSFAVVDFRAQRITAALEYIDTLRQSLRTFEPKPGKAGRLRDPPGTGRRALAVNVTFLDIDDT